MHRMLALQIQDERAAAAMCHDNIHHCFPQCAAMDQNHPPRPMMPLGAPRGWRKPENNTHSGAESQRGYNLDPVPVRILYWPAGRFEPIEAVSHPAAQELVQKINREKGAGRYAYILDKCALQRRPLMLEI
jgi:hypothetical protein